MTTFVGWMGREALCRYSFSSLKPPVGGLPLLKAEGENYALTAAKEAMWREGEMIILAAQADLPRGRMQDLLNAYRRHGSRFLSELSAMLVIIDAENQRLVLAADPIGLNHIYYAKVDDGIVFGSRADFVVCHPAVDKQLSAQGIYDYVYFHHCPSPGTIYRQVQKLEGGQCLVYQNGEMTLERYWLPDFQESGHGDLAREGEHLQALLLDAVQRSVGNVDETGAFLSGGLDSSSVAAALSKVFPGQAKTFTMGFAVAGYDEIEYANIAAKSFNTRQHEYYVTPDDVVKALPSIAAYYDEPFGNSSALATYYCAKLAKENGVTRLLAGDGGDELFAGNERYAKQMLFEYYRYLPDFAATLLDAGLACLPAVLARQKIPFKAKRYIEQAKTALPDRLQDYNFLHRHAPNEVFDGDFLADIDIARPLQLQRICYRRPEKASALNRMLYLDWKMTLHDNDLVKVNRMCEMAGVEVCYPLLDQRIIELSCRIASDKKLKGQQLRWFYKQAMADFLPAAILKKSKHGFGLPFGVWLKSHQPLQQLAYDAICALKQRRYFKPQFLDHAIKMHQSIHAGYYGELIWVLMMLELWLQGKEY